MSKFTTVTKQNAHLILFRINKFLQNNDAVSHYTDWGKYPKIMNKLGIFNFDDFKFIEKSNTGYILKSKYKISLNPDYGILIRASTDCIIGIVFGDKVCISPNNLVVKGYEIFNNKHYTAYYSPSSNIKKAEQEYIFEEQMSKDYWAQVEDEWDTADLEKEISKGDI